MELLVEKIGEGKCVDGIPSSIENAARNYRQTRSRNNAEPTTSNSLATLFIS
jgi:hypothetical protein